MKCEDVVKRMEKEGRKQEKVETLQGDCMNKVKRETKGSHSVR
jgi:hypothetical protein